MFGTLPPLRAAIHHERLKFSGSLAALFGDVDLLLVPTMPMPIPTLAKMGEYGADPGVLLSILRFTAVFDFSGSPTITLPVGMASDQMPLSMQLVGSHLSEEVLHAPRTPSSRRRTGIRSGLPSDDMLATRQPTGSVRRLTKKFAKWSQLAD
jgi:hypothetical protein